MCSTIGPCSRRLFQSKKSLVKVPLFAVAIAGGQSIHNAAFTRQIFTSYSLTKFSGDAANPVPLG
jgi:hypothetical protein